jgi:hypothetical protein
MQEAPAYFTNLLVCTLIEALEEQYEVEITSDNSTYFGVVQSFDESWVCLNYYSTNSEPGNIDRVTAIVQRIIRLSDVTAIVFNVTESNLNGCLKTDIDDNTDDGENLKANIA